jgi:pyruvate carboxylase
MLLRSASAVGYTNYPDNVVRAFVKESAAAGIDLFRIFDALNGLPNLRLAIDAVRDTGMLCEAAICYTGDLLNPQRPKYNLSYYVNLAKELEKAGANLLAIKDMAGLCKPYAARMLVKALRQEVGLPIHFHGRRGRRVDRRYGDGPVQRHDESAEPERRGRGAALPAARPAA